MMIDVPKPPKPAFPSGDKKQPSFEIRFQKTDPETRIKKSQKTETRSLLVEYCVMVMENSSSFLKYALQTSRLRSGVEKLTRNWEQIFDGKCVENELSEMPGIYIG